MNGLFPPSAPCPLWDRALSVSRWGHRTLRGAIFSHCLRRGAHRAPAVPREWPQFLRRGGSQTRPPHRCEAGGRKPPHPSQHTPCHLPPSGGKALGVLASGRTSCARRSPTGRPYSARTGAIPSWGMPANSTHQRRQYKRGNRVWSTTRAGRGRHAQGPRLPYRGAGESGLRDSGGTHVEPWSRRERHPAALCLLCRRGQSRPPLRAESPRQIL